MFSTSRYLVRSRQDGQYLVARIKVPDRDNLSQYVLVFNENYDALSYLNTHARELADRFSVETVNESQLKSVIQRWGFNGIASVKEPIEPLIEFITYEKGFL